MKYINLVLWTFCIFILMFSSFPLRVECRPSRVMGPGPPASNSVKITSSHRSQSISSTCPYLEGPSVWPSHVSSNADTYPTDITLKVWNSELVLEGTARSRSEVREDGKFGVTFDLSRIVKGDSPILRRRNQFRLQFLDNPINNNNNVMNMFDESNTNSNSINLNSSSSTPRIIPSTQQTVHSNYPRSISTITNNIHINANFSPSSSSHYHQQQQQQQQLAQLTVHNNNHDNNSGGGGGMIRNKKMSISNSLSSPPRSPTLFTIDNSRHFTISNSNNNKVNSNNNKCAPPKATIKTGRKYFVFVTKLDNHFIPIFSPELVNKKNTKILNSTFCHGCEQPPGVVAAKEVVLDSKKRLKLRCRLHKGFPIPTLVWFKDGKLINFGDSRYRLRAKRRQSILVIRKAKQSDAGLYKCEAKNYLGSAYANTKVILPKVVSSTTLATSTTVPPRLIKTPTLTTARTLPPLTSSECPYDSYCLNGGTCNYYPSILEYVCQCAEGYKGQRCDVKDIPTSGSMYLSYFCTFGTINPHYPCSPSR